MTRYETIKMFKENKKLWDKIVKFTTQEQRTIIMDYVESSIQLEEECNK